MKIKIEKNTMLGVALLLIVVALTVGFNTNKLHVYALSNESIKISVINCF